MPKRSMLLALCLTVFMGCKANREGAAGSGAGGSSGQGGASSSGVGGMSGGAGGSGGSSGSGGAAGGIGVAGTAGSAGTAGTEAHAGIDAAVVDDASTPVDRCATARFCDTFEGYALGGGLLLPWENRGTNGEIEIVDDEQHSGSKSVRFTTNNNNGGKNANLHLAGSTLFPVPGNMYFGRMMFRLDSAPEAPVQWTFIESGGLIEGESHRARYRYGGQHPVSSDGSFVGSQLTANYDAPDADGGNGPVSDCWLHADGTVVPVGRWACAEWQFDGPNNTMRFWLDGQPVEDLTMTGLGEGCVHQAASFEWTAPTFEYLDLGWISFQDDPTPRTLHVDDVIIDTARIGCPRSPSTGR